MRKFALTGLTTAALVLGGGALTALPAHAAVTRVVAQAKVAGDGTCATGTQDAPYSTIQSAVDAADNGDTILVCSGTYTEHVDTAKSLTFYGAFAGSDARATRGGVGETIWEGAGGAGALNASGDNVTVNGFTFALGGSCSCTSSVQLNGANGMVEDNIFSANDVSVGGEGDNLTVQYNKFAGLTGSTNQGVDIESHGQNDTIQYNDLASYFYNEAFMINVPDGTTGIKVQYNNVDVSDGGSFAVVVGTEGAYIGHNTITGNASADWGMVMGGGNKDYTISANTFSGFGGGPAIYFEGYSLGSSNNDGGYISQNGFHDNRQAIETANNLPSTTPLHINGNTFINNGAGLSPTDQNDPGVAIWDGQGVTIDATNNYWGCDTGPNTTGCDFYYERVASSVTVSPWLQLTGSLDATSIPHGGTANLTATLQHSSDNTTGPLPLIDPLLSLHYSFDKGSVSPTEDPFLNQGEGVVTGSTSGAGTVTISVANSQVQIPLTVEGVPVTTLPGLVIHDNGATEGNSGTHTLSFKVTLSKKATQAVTVHFATSNGSAKAGSDFVAKSGTLTIAKGKTVGYVTIQIKGDKVKEPNEVFYVTLSNPKNAKVTGSTATGVIRNDDK